VSKLAFRLLDMAENRRIAGYVLAIILAVGWYLHAKYQRRQITNEMQRISDHRTELQARVLGTKVKSSEESR
jgi:hypothetical protein